MYYWQKKFSLTSFVCIGSGIFIVIESSLGLRHFCFEEAITCYDNLLHTWWHLLKLSFFMKRSRVYLVVSVACFSSTEAWIMQTDIILSFYSSISSTTFPCFLHRKSYYLVVGYLGNQTGSSTYCTTITPNLIQNYGFLSTYYTNKFAMTFNLWC